MNLSQLQQGLEQAFYIEQHRIVFWYDAEQSFSEEVKDFSYRDWETDRKSTRLNSSHRSLSRMPSSA